jgi:translation initiation factor IF-2
MSTVRINELARELEVKSRAILDALTEVGVTEKKTHSSSIEVDEAERVRAHILKGRGGSGGGAARHEAEAKPKIDWSRVSKPGDAAKAILESRHQESVHHAAPPPAAATAQAAPRPNAPTAPAVMAKPAASAAPTAPAAVAIVRPAAETKPARSLVRRRMWLWLRRAPW